MCFLVLFFGLLQLDGIDLQAIFNIAERVVEAKLVGRGHVSSLGVLGEWAQFGTCK